MIFLFTCGIPVFLLEVALGQYTSEGGITCWRKISPLFEGTWRCECLRRQRRCLSSPPCFKTFSWQVSAMAPRWSWLCWTSTTSLFWPGGFSTCPSPSPGTWPGHPATIRGTQVTASPKSPPLPLRILTFLTLPFQKTVWNFWRQTLHSTAQPTQTPPLLS